MGNNIIVCSMNPVKIGAVKKVLKHSHIIAMDCPSNVAAQPFGHHETLQGAKNRTQYALKQDNTIDMAIAFEAGVDIIVDQPYVIQWAVVTMRSGQSYSVQGVGIELPKSFAEPLKQGIELAQLIDDYSGMQDIRSKNGALGILTNNYITRQQVYEQMLNIILHYHK